MSEFNEAVNTPAETPQTAQAARFWAKVAIARSWSDCWIWQASRGGSSYGHTWLTLDGHTRCIDAHRAAFMLARGPIPHGQIVMHLCNRKLCVNPWHLEIGTPRQNTADALRDGLAGVKLRASDIRKIVAERHAGRLRVEIAARHGVRESYVSAILTGQRWRAVTGMPAPASRQRENFMLSFDL